MLNTLLKDILMKVFMLNAECHLTQYQFNCFVMPNVTILNAFMQIVVELSVVAPIKLPFSVEIFSFQFKFLKWTI